MGDVTYSVPPYQPIKGREVGCASGQAFHKEGSGDDGSCLESTDSSESYSSNSMESGVENEGMDRLQTNIDEQSSRQGSSSFDQHYEEENDYDSQEGWLSIEDVPSRKSVEGVPSRKRINQREQRTRFCFIFFSFVALICVTCILVFSFGPMKEAARTSEDILLASHDALDQVAASLNAIQDASDGAEEIVKSTPLDLDTLCPQIKRKDIEAELGFDLNDLVNTVSNHYDGLNGRLGYQLRVVKNIVSKIDTGLITFDRTVYTIENFMWFVPGLLFVVSLLASVAAFGVLVAWKEKSGTRVQRIMSYFILPMLIIVSLASWIVVICASVGTMVGSDLCMAGPAPGSPDETIQQILSSHGIPHNHTAFKLINAYTNRCQGSDSTEDVTDLTDLQKTIQETIDFIWRQISQIDSIGRAKVVEQCGGEGLEDLFGGARNLAKVLKAITNSLDSVTGSLACSRINPIYVEAAHNTVCNDAASAVAFGFVFFLLLGISTMTMISLRASWLRNIEEEKVYHDESEIAENMILDEHEEYLNYISRYKHEWQEYRGFEETSVIQSHEDSFEDEDSLYFDDGRGYYGSEEFSDEENSDVSNPTGFDVDIFPPSLHTPSIDDGARACAIDEISFQSLSGHKSEESASIGENEFFGMPKPLLPPPENPNYRADAPDEILIPSQEVVLKDSKSRTKRRHSSKKATSKTNDEGLTKFFDKYGIDPFAHEKEIEEHMKSDPMEEGKLDGKYDASMEVVVRTRAMSSGGVERCVRRPSSGEIARPRSSGDELLRRRQSGAGAGDLAPRSRTYTPGQSAMDSEEQFVGCEI